MSIPEYISKINIINNEEMEEDSNTTDQDSSNIITKNNLHKIHQIFLGDLKNNSFQQIIVKNEIECFYSQINNLSSKERLVLNTFISIIQSSKNPLKSKFLTYIDIQNDKENNNIYNDEDDFNIDNKIFVAVDRVAHKTLHKNQIINGKSVKICAIYDELNKMEFKESENISYNNIDKLINKLKLKKNKNNLEFIALKAIIISMINLTEELINSYFIKSDDVNLHYNLINEEYFLTEEVDTEENNIILFKPNLFETIFNDYIYTRNMCPFLENYFIESFNNFREKYNISFTLSDLFTDIFWNCIFHNKILCNKFISIYIGNDTVSENIITILRKIIKIISDISTPLKSQVLQLLQIENIENKDDIDLMTTVVKQKNINHNFLKNENIINSVNKSMNIINDDYNNKNKEDNNDIQNNDNDNNNNNNNDINKSDNSNNSNNDNNDNDNEDDLEHKTVDEVYNYINDNNKVKSKKKKRTKKKKNKKKENEIKEFNDDDPIVSDFKKEIEKDGINANEINKVKPIISEIWLKKVSNY